MINILKQFKTNVEKIEVKNSGDSTYLPGEIVDRIKFDNNNEKLQKKKNLQLASFNGNY